MKNKLLQKTGFTLVEVAIGAGILGVGIAGILMASLQAKQFTEQTLLKTVANSYIQELVEYISRLDYSDALANDHDFDGYLTTSSFNASLSGIGPEESPPNPDTLLTEHEIGYKTPVFGYPSTATSINPIDNSPSGITTPDYPYSFLGFEVNDIDFQGGPYDGTCYIYNYQYDMHLVGGTKAKYFFADDVDDFNGYEEVITDIIPGVDLTLRVAVQGIAYNQPVTYNDGTQTYTLNTAPFQDVGPLSRIRMLTGVTISGVTYAPPSPAVPDNSAADAFCEDIINNQLIMKKITIVAEWTYPPGSGGTTYREVYYIGKSKDPGVDILS